MKNRPLIFSTILTVLIMAGCKQHSAALKTNTDSVRSETKNPDSIEKTKPDVSTKINTPVKQDSATIIKQLIKGSWAADGENNPDFKVGDRKVTYFIDPADVPYEMSGDSLFFKSTDYDDHYKIVFSGKDTMSMIRENVVTKFHRIKD